MVGTKQGDHRRNKRIAFIKDVEIVGLGMYRCSDLSIGGMYIETVHVFPVGTPVDLQFKLNDEDEQPVKAQARVLYVHEGFGLGLGLGFVNLDQENHGRLKQFIEAG